MYILICLKRFLELLFWKQVAVINIIAWSSCHRQSVRTDPTNTFHSLHFPLLLFRLQSPQQCVCLCALRRFRHPSWYAVRIFPISQVPCRSDVWSCSHLSPASNRWGIFGWNVYSRVLTTLGFHVAPLEVVPVVIFHFGPLGPRCGPGPCVYAARGDAWRQTSTPHPNNGPLLGLPPLCWLIIRIVSKGKWGRNAPRKALWSPQSKLSGLHSHFFGSQSLSSVKAE